MTKPPRGHHDTQQTQITSRISWPGPIATIALAQLLGTSLWFSANSAADDLMSTWNLTSADIGWLTSAVQAGFILGTLAIALGGIADGFKASRIFVIASATGALFNACFAWFSDGLLSAAIFRFLVGVCLAGIYPMGMKLVVSWSPHSTGQALAQLVAMLTLGTALPHALRGISGGMPWQYVMIASSIFALVGACLIYQLGDGPYLPATRTSTTGTRHAAVFQAFRISGFRAAAWGYFGHMWELYTFWTIVPLLIQRTVLGSEYSRIGIASLSFTIIGMGAAGSLAGGVLSRHLGSAKVALGALTCSLMCSLLFVMYWSSLPACALLIVVLAWGATVVADSPQFSALSAKACPPHIVGAALAIQNSIGFAITVVSISVTTTLFEYIGIKSIWVLLPGPIIGLLGFALASQSSSEQHSGEH